MTPEVCLPEASDARVVALAPRVRRLAAAQSLSALARALAPIVDELAPMRWIALETTGPHPRRCLYVLRGDAAAATAALARLLGSEVEADVQSVEPGRASPPESQPDLGEPSACAPLALPIVLERLAGDGTDRVGTLVVAPAHEGSLPLDALAVVARELGAAVRVASLVCEAERLSTTDGLTGALNRPAFASALELEMARAGRFGYTVAILLVGVDHFSRLNESRGADAADAVLRGVARVLAQRVRSVDLVARWDGDTFGVALCGSTFDGALTAADRLRAAVEATPFPGYEQPVHLTVSVGVGMIAGSIPAAVDTATRALAMAKETGRNRVGAVVDSGLPESSLREREWRAVARLAGR